MGVFCERSPLNTHFKQNSRKIRKKSSFLVKLLVLKRNYSNSFFKNFARSLGNFVSDF